MFRTCMPIVPFTLETIFLISRPTPASPIPAVLHQLSYNINV